MRVEPEVVERLEREIERAIAEAMAELGRDQLSLLPDRRTQHLMAKGAVTVYEAAVEQHRPGR